MANEVFMYRGVALKGYSCGDYYCRTYYNTMKEALECEAKHWRDAMNNAVAERDADFAITCHEELAKRETALAEL